MSAARLLIAASKKAATKELKRPIRILLNVQRLSMVIPPINGLFKSKTLMISPHFYLVSRSCFHCPDTHNVYNVCRFDGGVWHKIFYSNPMYASKPLLLIAFL